MSTPTPQVAERLRFVGKQEFSFESRDCTLRVPVTAVAPPSQVAVRPAHRHGRDPAFGRRTLFLIGLLVALSAWLPLAAEASTASVVVTGDVPRLTITDGVGEVNHVSISTAVGDDCADLSDMRPSCYSIEDEGALITPENGCARVPATATADTNQVVCSDRDVISILVSLGRGDDQFSVGDLVYPPGVPITGVRPVDVEGGPGSDTLTGGSGIDGLRGDDPSKSDPGSDVLTGGDGRDLMVGDAGDDRLDGGADVDRIFGNAGGDSVLGGPGDDERLEGGADADTVDGGEGNDDVSGNDGMDTVLGSAGGDTLAGGDDADTVDGGEGNDNVRGNDGRDDVLGGAGDDRLDFPRTDAPEPAGGADSLQGGPGDDDLSVGPRSTSNVPDHLSGGAGTDKADFSDRSAPLTIDLDGQADDGEAGEGDNVEPDVENVIGGADDDTLTGSDAADNLDGREGEDTLAGRGGDDMLVGGVRDEGGDTLRGEEGSDTLMGGPGEDAMAGGEQVDKLFGGGGADSVDGDRGGDTLEGGAGADTIDGGEGIDSLHGGGVVIVGADGPDELIGGPGDDILLGGRGNDRLDGGFGADYISGQTQRDTVTFEDRKSKVSVTLLDGQNNDGERGELDNVLADVEVIVGGIRGDDLVGDADGNTVEGGSGEDFIDGKLDSDRLVGGEAPDIVRARDGVADEVSCGDAGDLAIVDRRDNVSECETVDRAGARRIAVGITALVRPQGEFRLRLRQGRRFFPLTEKKLKIRMGSTIDPKAGVVRLATAKNRAGARQAASVSAGRFTVHQSRRRRPVTELELAGRLPCRGSAAKRPAASLARSLRVDVRKKHRRGRYKVKGRYSIGASRGTEWITEDRCDGTLTTVISGTVRVRDFGRRETVTVRPGKPYLAAP
jgi:Ca2+-binding RTX toxin-like protein